jgi:hypothetical protein
MSSTNTPAPLSGRPARIHENKANFEVFPLDCARDFIGAEGRHARRNLKDRKPVPRLHMRARSDAAASQFGQSRPNGDTASSGKRSCGVRNIIFYIQRRPHTTS